MMLHFLTPLLCLVIMTAHSHAADSFIKAYPSGKKLYSYDGQYIKAYPSGKKLYKVDGYAIKAYPSGKTLIITKAASSRPILQVKNCFK